MLAACIIIAIIKPPRISQSGPGKYLALNKLPDTLFEFKGGIRKIFIPTFLIYICTLAASYYMVAIFVAAMLLGLSFTGFFIDLEAKEYLKIYFLEGQSLLGQKVLHYSLLMFCLLIPHMILFLIFHLEYWYLLPVAPLFLITIVNVCLLYKYAHYRPINAKVYNTVPVAFCLMGMVLPFFFPVIILYLIYYWFKAQKNLKVYYVGD